MAFATSSLILLSIIFESVNAQTHVAIALMTDAVIEIILNLFIAFASFH